MRAVVTVLRARGSGLGAAATATVDYLVGPRAAQQSLASTVDAPVEYYADQTPEGPGRWLGAGAGRFGLRGDVHREPLAAVLRGEDPRSGRPLVSTRGSTRRARAAKPAPAQPAVSWAQDRFTFQEAATLLGITDRYLRKVAGRTRMLLDRTGGDATTLAAVHGRRAFLMADHDDSGRWSIDRGELERFAASREDASVVIGYDVTFTVPKSVSILWATADPRLQAALTDSLEGAVAVGFEYLEAHAAMTGRGVAQTRGAGFVAGAFTHGSSRRLDPHLHTHVVIANLIERADGEHRSVDASGLFEHAKTAGYLAGAQLRHELSRRLGVEWRPVSSGIFEIDGIPQAAIDAMSTRSAEIDALAAEHAVTTPSGHRRLAQQSRPAKTSIAIDDLRADWHRRLTDAGFDPARRNVCLDRQTGVASADSGELASVCDRLLSPDGLTGPCAVFSRGDVIQALADWSGDRLDATSIATTADLLLSDPRVLALEPRPGRSAQFTTRAMVRAELKVLNAFRAGLHEPRVTELEMTDARVAEIATSGGLSDEQRRAVSALCRSRARIRCLVGPAGSGKTHTLRVAGNLWQETGHRVIGAAVQGTAAEHLEAATDIPSRTVASLLHRVERAGPNEVLDPTTIVVVDEASAVGTFDLARLMSAVEETGAGLVLAGDPAQHQSVAAGGGFAALVRRHPHRVVRLREQRRQARPEMSEVRRAVDELRRRDTDTGLHRLFVDGRVTDATTRAVALDSMVADWATDRHRGRAGGARTVCMVSEDHRTRRALIARARAHLAATGELGGPVLAVAGQEFQAGDEVIARAPSRGLHPPRMPELHVRNGTTGRVTSVRTPETGESGLVVEFAGRGEIFVPDADLQRPIRPGVAGVLTHSYALTSHAAQGATFDVARAFTTPTTSPAGLYVAASRGRDDVHLYTASPERRDDDPHVVRDAGVGLAAVAASLQQRREDGLVLDRDPTLAARLTETPGSPTTLAARRGDPAGAVPAPVPDDPAVALGL